MQKKHFFLAILLFCTNFAMAQRTQTSIYSGIFSILGLDYRWYNPKGKPDFAASAAFGSVLGIQANSFLVDGRMIFWKKHSLVTGISLYNHFTRYVGRSWVDGSVEPVFYESKSFIQSLSFPIGYRFQKPSQRMWLQVMASPVNLDWENGRFVGTGNGRSFLDVSFGVNLHKKDEKGQNISENTYFDADSTQKIKVQHSIYLTNPLLLGIALGYDVRLHGLGRYDYAFAVNASSRFQPKQPLATANFAATILFGKDNVPFEIGLNVGMIQCYEPLQNVDSYASAPSDNALIGLPLGFRYQSAKGDIFAKMGIMPYWYLKDQKAFALTANQDIRTHTYGNDLLTQVQAQIAIGCSFGQK
jgi:hypothetical protein